MHVPGRQRGSSSAGFDSEFFKNMFQVLVYRAVAHAKDVTDVAVGLALGEPGQHLGLSRRQRRIGQARRGGGAGAALLQQQHGFAHADPPHVAH